MSPAEPSPAEASTAGNRSDPHRFQSVFPTPASVNTGYRPSPPSASSLHTPISRFNFRSSESSWGSVSGLTTPTSAGAGYSTPRTYLDGEQSDIEFEDDEEGGGDGNDSDEEGVLAAEFGFRQGEELETTENLEASAQNFMPERYYFKDGSTVESATNYPRVPEGYVRRRQAERGEPEFCDVDNPGGWNDYIYLPHFGKDNQYLYHRQPSGVTPVPGDISSSVREHNGWKFFYKGWNGESGVTGASGDATGSNAVAVTQDEPDADQSESESDDRFHRKFATKSNLFPKERKGSLDVDKLKQYGLTRERMQGEDALFFYQLLLPMHDAIKTDIPNDQRKSYYPSVLEWTNLYAVSGKRGYSDAFQFSHLEHIKFDGILYKHGALGSKCNIKYRWDNSDCMFDSDIYNSGMSHYRWNTLKKNLKLCCNITERARSGDDYNPAHKFDFIYECLVHNVNEVTKRSCLDLVIDESTWPYFGFGGIFVDYLRNKMCSRGGQTVLLMDQDRLRPRGWLHRTKQYQRTKGFSTRGQSEVHDLISKFVLPKIGKLWPSPPHLTADNYFTGDSIFGWMGGKGLGMIGTVAKNQLPTGVDRKFLHKESAAPRLKPNARVARTAQPVTLVKDVPAVEADVARGIESQKAYRRVHCSFQSTGPCNIGSVNSVPSNNLYLEQRSRGRGENKRRWGIEMNESRELYLKSYGRIDQTDAFITRSGLKYKTWKFYHSAINHAKSIVIATAYDMYLECCEGELDPNWKIDKPMSFHKFQQRLAKQMISWDPMEEKYAGDHKLRHTKRHCMIRRNKRKSRSRHGVYIDGRNADGSPNVIQGPPLDQITIACKRRLCFNVGQLSQHISSKTTLQSRRHCTFCGESTHSYCTLCKDASDRPVPLCPDICKIRIGNKYKRLRKNCFQYHHDPNWLGLGRKDHARGLSTKEQWAFPTVAEITRNRKYMQFHLSTGNTDDTSITTNEATVHSTATATTTPLSLTTEEMPITFFSQDLDEDIAIAEV